MSDAVELNVGGQLFSTSPETLLGGSGSKGFFAALLATENLPKDRDSLGHIFLDRDPDLFAALLRYLRSGVWSCPPGFVARDVLQEARFYGINITTCDFTIDFLREAVKEREYSVVHTKLRTSCDAIFALLDSLVREGGNLNFAVVPTLHTLRELLRDKFLKTGADTTENIDVDKLHVLERSEEGVPCRFTDDIHSMLQSVPLAGVMCYLEKHYALTVLVSKGGMWFPYSTTVHTPEQTLAPPPSTHAPVFSKLHGTLHTFKDTPSSRVVSPDDFDEPNNSRYANLHQRFLAVCDAYYICWEQDREKPLAVDTAAPITPLCL